MAAAPYILAIDQGTTSTRALVFDSTGAPVATAAEPLEQIYPQAGWVEHDAEAIWQAVCAVARQVLDGISAGDVAALGITNQRETTVLWERATGAPLANAIVWQDRRTAPLCDALEEKGLAAHVSETTGLLIDPYFSATKVAWLLAEQPELRARAAAGEVCFGTIDSWLIFKLTGGRVHASDATNASRTMLYDIVRGRWDTRLLEALEIPEALLPEVKDCQADYGVSDAEAIGVALPILGVAGDQQAAAFGQACFVPGMIKATYGTGCFVLTNTGAQQIPSANRMLATIGWQVGGTRTYALEGSIFMAGAVVQWLRDGLGLISDAREIEGLAAAASPDSDVYLVPAFQGLGAPHWDPQARGAIVGLSRAATRNDIARAALEGIAFQTRDLLDAIAQDMGSAGLRAPDVLRVDGGMTANGWFMQCLADITGLPLEVASIAETTAAGAAYHAGLAAGVYGSQEDLAAGWRAAARYEPRFEARDRDARHAGWLAAVDRVKSRAQ